MDVFKSENEETLTCMVQKGVGGGRWTATKGDEAEDLEVQRLNEHGLESRELREDKHRGLNGGTLADMEDMQGRLWA